MILNITNGDSAVGIMQQAGIPGDFLPWRDVLHDGPVPDGLSLEELSQVRADFIVERGWGTAQAVTEGFIERDKTLRNYRDYTKVILWFEHDLYDQLQILQILDWFREHPPEADRLTIICTEHYLGMCTAEEMKALTVHEETVTDHHLRLAKKAWAAFRAATPEPWQALLHEDTALLPFLHGAVLRQLQEYPDCASGLSLTAQRALRIIAQGEQRAGRVFGSYQQTEDRRFMGDASFWVMLQQMLDANSPLLTLPPGKSLTLPTSPDQTLSITSEGEAVLDGKRNWLEINGVDHWIGGVHLTPENLWCWNSNDRRLCKQ
ncbi:MAG: hypothetical protein ABFR65_06625 [Pseudomonadota bacterium]